MRQIKVSFSKPRAERLLDSIRSGKISFIRSLLSQGYSPNGDSDESKVKHPLDLVIELGSHQIVSLLIEFGANLDSPVNPSRMQIALHRAVIRGNMKIIMTILERTVNWQVADVEGATVMHLAMESREENEIEILKVFLDRGMNVDVKTLKGETPLFIAGKGHRREVIDFLVERGADFNVQNCDGDSLIHYFLKYKYGFGGFSCMNIRTSRKMSSNVDFVEWLISRGADIDCKNNAGQSPFQLALQHQMASASLILLKYMKDSLDFTDNKNHTFLHSVLEFNISKISNHDVKIHRATEKVNQVETIIEILISKGCPVDAIDRDGNTVLHIAAKEKKFFIFPKLLEHLADVNTRNNKGETAMHLLIKHSKVNEDGLEGAVRQMLAKGAHMTIISDDGLNSVQLAVKMKNLPIVNLFKEKGADLKVLTTNFENLWHIFASNKAYVNGNETNENRLYERYVDMNKEMIKFLVGENLDINGSSLSGSTPLHVALHNCNFSIVEELVNNGADVNLREKCSQLMPIHIAAQKDSVKTVEFLVRAGADVNAEVFSLSALHLAARHCQSLIMKTLVRLGANVDAVDEDNRTPLHYVICNTNFRAFVYFLEIGVSNCYDAPLGQISNHSLLATYKDALEYMIKYECLDMPFRNVCTGLDPAFKSTGYSFDILNMKMMDIVDKIKSLRIDNETSLYDFLRMGLKRRMFNVHQGNIEKILDAPDFKIRFSEYHDMIMHKYREALMRKSLLVTAKRSFSRLIDSSLPDLCVENVLDYLDNSTLKVLSKVNNDVMQSDCFSEDEVLKLYPDCKKNLYRSLILDDSKEHQFYYIRD